MIKIRFEIKFKNLLLKFAAKIINLFQLTLKQNIPMQRAISVFIISFLCFLFGISSTFSQPFTIERTIEWQIIKNTSNSEKEFNKFFSFEGAGRDLNHPMLPVFHQQIAVNSFGTIHTELKNAVYEPVGEDTNFTKLLPYLSTEIQINSTISIGARKPYALISLIPLRKNPETGKLEKLINFTIDINIKKEPQESLKPNVLSKKGSNSSVLASGRWNKIGVTENGIYKLDYNFLKQANPDLISGDPRNIHIYGKAGGMLPEVNSAARDSDLVENAIKVIGEEDGVFNEGDYILFYGQGQTVWKLNQNTRRFYHQINYYSDTSYYFITTNSNRGKRISVQPSLTDAPSKVISSYDDYAYHHLDQWTTVTKEVKSGREWYGEEFNAVTNYNFSLNFPAYEPNTQAYLRSSVGARSNIETNFDISVNNSSQLKQNVSRLASLDPSPYTAFLQNRTDTFLINAAPVADIKIKYNKLNNNSIGWLNYMEMNVRSVLRFHSGQFSFRDGRSVQSNGINEYRIQNAPGNMEVWDVTDFHNVKTQAPSANTNGTFTFRASANKLMEYVAFDGSRYLQPVNFGNVPNQDLHSLSTIDMVIISPAGFLPAAQRLSDFHKKYDNLNVFIVTPQQIYNEFSSGAQDISAIRDFMKLLYDNASSAEEAPKYLMLLGDASYDYKNRVKDNTNFIPTYESAESITLIESFCSDDYFGFLDKNEGLLRENDLLDLGIGRLPVRTLEQANAMVDKILRYHDAKTMEDWRNVICFVADDEEGNAFIENCEGFTDYIGKTSSSINVDKIYIDSYKQESTPSGQRYPAAMDAINKRMSSGALILTYFGHGGEQGLAHERIIDIDMINAWNNTYRMPLFITGTCEFSRFDDPVRTSAGELCVLNPKGGPIASFTTTRVVTIGQNETLGLNIYKDNIFKVVDGKVPTLGDILRKAKNRSGFTTNTLNFSLLGDPALKLALPQHQVITTEINAKPVTTGEQDTLKALSLMTIKGVVADRSGKTLTSYNGTIYPTIYDKPQNIKTLRNDPGSYVTTFTLRNSIIYRGKASVKNGEFSFEFIVPKDISYQNAIGKISYYATDGKEDANGDNQQIVIGGTSDDIVSDDQGPEIQLFINDTNFIAGGLVDDTPVLIAKVRDDIGINTVGNGIGHELTGVLNNGEPIILNSYYQAKLDDYKQGNIIYPFASLPDGQYHLKVKVWDVANNSSEAYTDFVVAGPNNLSLKRVFNYPNPLTDKTTFSFEHNLPDEDLTIEINIFDIRGGLVKTIKAEQNGSSSRVNNIDWDAKDDFGGPMAAGVYVYRLMVKTAGGKVAQQSQRLVVIR